MIYTGAPDRTLDAGFMADYGDKVRETEKKLVRIRYSEAIAITAMTKDLAMMVTPWITEDDLRDTEYLKVFVIGQEDSILLNAAGYKYLLPDGYEKAVKWLED